MLTTSWDIFWLFFSIADSTISLYCPNIPEFCKFTNITNSNFCDIFWYVILIGGKNLIFSIDSLKNILWQIQSISLYYLLLICLFCSIPLSHIQYCLKVTEFRNLYSCSTDGHIVYKKLDFFIDSLKNILWQIHSTSLSSYFFYFVQSHFPYTILSESYGIPQPLFLQYGRTYRLQKTWFFFYWFSQNVTEFRNFHTQ